LQEQNKAHIGAAMSIAILQNLTEDKFQSIANHLMRGVPAKELARIIQREWGDAQDVNPATLTRALERLHLSTVEQVFGDNSSEQPQAQSSDRAFESPYDELGELLTIQFARIEKLLKVETQQNKYVPALSEAIATYRNTLVQMQKMRFDLGLDEYKRVTLSRREREADKAEAKEAHKRQLYNAIIEAVAVAEDIFLKRRIGLGSTVAAADNDASGASEIK
jgi:hypothetical protein